MNHRSSRWAVPAHTSKLARLESDLLLSGTKASGSDSVLQSHFFSSLPFTPNTLIFNMLLIDPGSSCDICTRVFEASSTMPAAPKCGHIFCSGCLRQIIREARGGIGSCPTCRRDFVENDITQLYVEWPSRDLTRRFMRLKREGMQKEEDCKKLVGDTREFLHTQEGSSVRIFFWRKFEHSLTRSSGRWRQHINLSLQYDLLKHLEKTIKEKKESEARVKFLEAHMQDMKQEIGLALDADRDRSQARVKFHMQNVNLQEIGLADRNTPQQHNHRPVSTTINNTHPTRSRTS